MSALTILIIRHAEKPGEAWPGPGLTPDGVADKKSLVIRGWQRAGGWSALFGGGLGGDDFPAPTAIYALNPNATTGDDPSQRPFETITPLAARLTLTPIVKYPLGAEHDLVAEIVGLAGVVLVSWEHKAIAKYDPSGHCGRSDPSRDAKEVGRSPLRRCASVRPERARGALDLPPTLPAPHVRQFRDADAMSESRARSRGGVRPLWATRGGRRANIGRKPAPRSPSEIVNRIQNFQTCPLD